LESERVLGSKRLVELICTYDVGFDGEDEMAIECDKI
jgi:hypothetical protein